MARIDALIAKLEILIDKQLEGNEGRTRIATIWPVPDCTGTLLCSFCQGLRLELSW